jgi:hypothetical protein
LTRTWEERPLFLYGTQWAPHLSLLSLRSMVPVLAASFGGPVVFYYIIVARIISVFFFPTYYTWDVSYLPRLKKPRPSSTLFRNSNGNFKPLLGSGGDLISVTAARRFRD